MIPEALRAKLALFIARNGLGPEAAAEAEFLLHEGLQRRDDTLPAGANAEVTLTLPGPAQDEQARDATVTLERMPALIPDYEDLGLIGRGGMGEVRRVRDRSLRRTMAQKLLRLDLVHDAQRVTRFVEEAQISAQLEHPGIVPVHALGRLPDGRCFFTMREIRGRTLNEVVAQVHAAGGKPTGGGWTVRRLVDAFHKACEAVAYAHSQGVLHRDLKPQNVMVGDYGEVLVVDWGLAKVMGSQDEAPRVESLVRTVRSESSNFATQMGDVTGTPAYMAPEQAAGQIHLFTPATDVYALGGILFEILTGQVPFEGTHLRTLLSRVHAGQRRPLTGALPIPDELRSICDKAMARAPEHRFPDAHALAAEVAAWLDGARRTDQALEIVARADQELAELHALHAQVARAKEQASLALHAVASFEPIEAKKPGWALEDEAEVLEHEAEIRELSYLQHLRSALNLAPELPQTHDRLADYYQARHARAEARRDTRAAESLAVLLGAHDIGGRYGDYLRGDGSMTIVPDPPDAELSLYAYTLEDRRLVPVFRRSLGHGAARDVALPMGSYLVIASAAGRVPVRYPVHIGRQSRWDGVPPGETEPLPIVLPSPADLGEDDVYVPAGWFIRGGDPHASYGTPWARVWEDAFQHSGIRSLEFT